MSEPQYDDELTPTLSVGDLDPEDNVLRRWKESIGIIEYKPADDPRHVVVFQLALQVEGRPDIVFDFSTPENIERAKNTVVVLKEGVTYHPKVKFRIQHTSVFQLKYVQVTSRIFSSTTEKMIGGYSSSEKILEIVLPSEEAPNGLFACGHYDITSKFVGDDNFVHLEWNWKLEVKEDW
jgi:Rho GDP-dissociation inhibitor